MSFLDSEKKLIEDANKEEKIHVFINTMLGIMLILLKGI
jgi:hypothetical protein